MDLSSCSLQFHGEQIKTQRDSKFHDGGGGARCYEITHLNLGVREGSLDKLIPRLKAK